MSAKETQEGTPIQTQPTDLLVCQGTNCSSSKSDKLRIALEQELARSHLRDIRVRMVGCHGFCQVGPTVLITPGNIFYTHVEPEDALEIVQSHMLNGKPVQRLFYRDPVTNETIPNYEEIDFFRKQTRVVLSNCGQINPERIEDYLALGGYRALKMALRHLTPDEVIEEIRRSGLRGRGGAGFPVADKWEVCRQVPGREKYIICNDRNTLEGDPHTLIEGIILSAYAMGAQEGFIVFRVRSSLGFKRLQMAIDQAETHGFLGQNILGSNFTFRLQLKEGIEDFVCGEETALIASLEGDRCMPRPRPPYPAEYGFQGKPTIVHNSKTMASVPSIIRNGSDWYSNLGTETSKGTAILALTGKVFNTGTVEVPMNMTLKELIYDIGGGIPGGKHLKAVHIGGPSGGFIPADQINSPIDYETLEKVGGIMGSGAVVVLDEDSCMVDNGKFFLSSTQLDSCGKCIQCRWGLKQMLDIMEDITTGNGRLEDIDLLIETGEAVKTGSLCGLGKTAPNPVLTSIRYFRGEWELHIKRAHCPAAVCKGLVKAPCSHTCPAGVDVPRYLRRIAERKYDEAVAVIRERIPFPSVCGYVCIHPCETKCRRGQIDEPIAIRALKRFAADHAHKGTLTPERIAAPSGKRVSIVGSGPAGLTAAYYLAKIGGHAVTVFEALPEVGGMMRVGIPRYRLPAKILDNEIDAIRHVGVEIRTNTPVESVNELREQGYDAIFFAIGAHAASKMRVEGEDIEGVMDCVTFLRDVSLGKKVKLGDRIAVIGGGNAAIDASRTALRLGAKDVSILYRRTQDEMPADPEEIHGALDEGVHIDFLVAPSRIYRDNGHIDLECIRMQLGEPDASGRKRPEPISGSEFNTEVDVVIAAIGQTLQLPEDMGLELNRNHTVKVDPDSLATNVDGVFAGGDAVSGPASVIQAIAAGRQAAISIDRYLGGNGLIDETLASPEQPPSTSEPEDDKETEGHRPRIPGIPVGKRLKNFKLVELGLSEREAIEEAKRCLQCDLEEE